MSFAFKQTHKNFRGLFLVSEISTTTAKIRENFFERGFLQILQCEIMLVLFAGLSVWKRASIGAEVDY